MDFMGLEDEDTNQLDQIKQNNKSKKTLKTVLSRGKLNKRELDEMFLGY
jgi:hypothetical protein